jgi:hypothetical protein
VLCYLKMPSEQVSVVFVNYYLMSSGSVGAKAVV